MSDLQEFLGLAVLITFVVTVTGLMLSGVIHAALTSVPRRRRSAQEPRWDERRRARSRRPGTVRHGSRRD
jgi:hypothetical protein